MFRETDTNTQMSLFDNPADLMGKRAVKKYEDPKAWFNQFYELVTSQVDESVFKPLFKEGFGCSDEAPSLDTYYLLRRRICDYADATGEKFREHFTGKEDQNPDFGTAYTDFGARQYSPALRRWLVPDPLSEKYYGVSPYAYCAGDPVNLVDVDGENTGDYYSYWGYYVGTDGLYLIDDLSITNYLNAQSISQPAAVNALSDGAYEVDGFIIVTREQKNTDRTIGTFDAVGDDGFSGYTLEREYPTSIIPNQGRPIPVGYYNTTIRAEGEISNHFAFRIYSKDVPLSRGILGHIGTNPKNTQGCILFGMSRIQNPDELRNSGKAMNNFQVFFSSNKTIKLIIR